MKNDEIRKKTILDCYKNNNHFEPKKTAIEI
jgi:hypothetical protein